MRAWQVERRKRTRHLIELGGLVVKAGSIPQRSIMLNVFELGTQARSCRNVTAFRSAIRVRIHRSASVDDGKTKYVCSAVIVLDVGNSLDACNMQLAKF